MYVYVRDLEPIFIAKQVVSPSAAPPNFKPSWLSHYFSLPLPTSRVIPFQSFYHLIILLPLVN